jgi:hypothetical protein
MASMALLLPLAGALKLDGTCPFDIGSRGQGGRMGDDDHEAGDFPQPIRPLWRKLGWGAAPARLLRAWNSRRRRLLLLVGLLRLCAGWATLNACTASCSGASVLEQQ